MTGFFFYNFIDKRNYKENFLYDMRIYEEKIFIELMLLSNWNKYLLQYGLSSKIFICFQVMAYYWTNVFMIDTDFK